MKEQEQRRYTATTAGRVVDRETMTEVTTFECSGAGVREAMAFAKRLNEPEPAR